MPGFDQVSPLKIDREVRQNCQVFQFDGILDVFSMPTFCRTLEKVGEESPPNFILDFSNVDLMDISALGALVDLGRKIQANGGTLQVVGGSRVARVIRLARLELGRPKLSV